MTLDINYTTTNPRKVDQLLEDAVETAMIAQGNVTLAYPYTSAGIQAAVDRIVASGKPGTVVYASEQYSVTQNVPLVSGVSHLGVFVKLAFSGNVPDATFSPVDGTIINIAAGVEFLTHNSTDLASQPANVAPLALTGVTIKNMAFIGGKGAVKMGALYSMGPTYCLFENLYFKNQVDYHFWVENFQHCEFKNFHGRNDLPSTGGYHFKMSLNANLLPGNSHFEGEIFSYSTSRFAKNFVFEARGLAGCQMNEIVSNARMQANRYGDVATSYTVSTTSGSPNVVFSTPAESVNFPVGMPLVFTSATPNFLAANSVYYVVSNNGTDTITISNTPGSSTVSVSQTASFTIKGSGFPAVIIWGNNNSLINNCDFGRNFDIEANGNVCALSMYRVFNGRIGLNEVMGSQTDTAISARSCPTVIDCGNIATITTDFDDFLTNTVTAVNNAKAGNVYTTAGETLTSGRHQCIMLVNSATPVTITVPTKLVSGFTVSIVQVGAGQVTVAGSGVTVNGRNGLKTAGQYARININQYNKTSYIVSGDTAV